jgi:hypothetical protein
MNSKVSSRASRTLAVFAATVVAACALAAPGVAAAPDREDGVQVYARDTFEIVGSTLRTPDAGTDPAATLYTVSAVRLERPDGTPITWGAWSEATATSTARLSGAATDVRIALNGLVPGGRYSVYWGTLGPDSEQPLCPGVERTLPLDAFPAAQPGGGDPNAFVAGADGSADYRGRAPVRLLDAQQAFLSVVYHFAPGSTYPFPNRGELLTQGETCRSSFGDDTMRHMLILQKW